MLKIKIQIPEKEVRYLKKNNSIPEKDYILHITNGEDAFGASLNV